MDEETKIWFGELLKTLGEQNNKQLELLEQIRKMISLFYYAFLITIVITLLTVLLSFCGSRFGG